MEARGRRTISLLGLLFLAGLVLASPAFAGFEISDPTESESVSGSVSVYAECTDGSLEANMFYRFMGLKFDGQSASFSPQETPFQTDSNGNFAERLAGTWDTTGEVDKTASLVLRIAKGQYPPPPPNPEQTVDSDPRTVTTDNIQVEITSPADGDKFTFSSATPGVCSIDATASATPSSYNSSIYWTLQDMGGTTESYEPSRTGASRTLKYTTLPGSNGEFGDNTITAEIQGQDAEDMVTVKIFFPGGDDDTNNPGGADPNWYYYWKQTAANSGSHTYNSAAGSGRTVWSGSAWVAEIGPGANDSGACGAWGGASGIDFFANVCRHEQVHVSDGGNWWPNGYVAGQDVDGDWVKDSAESALGYDPTDATTFSDTYGYCPGWNDAEHHAMSTQASWTNYNASTDDYDWANPGKEY